MLSFAFLPDAVRANPTGGVVTHGDVGFEGLGTGNLQINQLSDKAIINWQDFSIGKGELTQFNQPGVNSLVLNRVVSGNPSSIFGTLKANGGVMVVNTNGILVGAGGVIDVAGALTLSTLDIDDNDFLNGGDNRFRGKNGAGVVNYGTINAGGDVVLLGNFIDNRGTIGSVDGTVALGAGGDIIVSSAGDAKISVKAAGRGGQVGINNEGTIEGASVELKTHGNVYALAINNSGMIRANGAKYAGGVLTLDAGPGGVITNTGTLQARNADGSGGTININAGPAGTVNLDGGVVDANGDGGADGGVIDVQGAYINIIGGAQVTADGGNGGSITVGNEMDTRSVIIGAGSTVSALGSGGDGGVINVTGRPDSVINIEGDILADGSVNGGTISVIGGVVTQFGSSTISAGGQSGSGGAINLNGATSVTADGNLNVGSLMGDGGTVKVGSILSDSATVGGNINAASLMGSGGNVDVTAREATTLAAGARVDVSGFDGAGTARIGGGYQGAEDDIINTKVNNVEAGAQVIANSEGGNAGKVIIWGDSDTTFSGDVSARAFGAIGNGGFVEVSGKDTLRYRGSVSTLAASGRTGTLLLDPTNVTITDGGTTSGGTISDDDINAALASNNLIIHTGGAGIDQGDIVVENHVRIEWGNPNSDFVADGIVDDPGNFTDFTLLANRDIVILGNIISHGAGNINLVAGWDGVTGAPTGAVDPAGVASTSQDSINGPIDFADLSTLGGAMFGTPGDGDVFINGQGNDQAVQVGSRFGETNVIANNLNIIVPDGGSERFAHLGYRPSTNAESGGAGLYGLVNTSNYRKQFATGYAAGSSTIDLEGGMFQVGAGDTLDLGAGHAGVYTVVSNSGGIITLDRGLDVAVGNGAVPNITYLATTTTATDFTTTNTSLAASMTVEIAGGAVDPGVGDLLDFGAAHTGGAYIVVSNVGGVVTLDRGLDVDVAAAEVPTVVYDVTVTTGNDFNTVSQGNFAGSNRFGSNTLDIDMRGSAFETYLINEGNSGDINVELQGSLTMTGDFTGDARKYTQIGHGGNSNSYDNDLRTGGNGNTSETFFSLINADSSGNIDVNVGLGASPAQISMRAGRDTGYSKIGHGGLSNPDGNATARGAGAFKGDISVVNNSGGIFAQGSTSNSWAGYVQIGHGGYRNSRGNDVIEGTDTNNTDARDNAGSRVGDAVNLNFDQSLGPRALDPDLLTPDGNRVGDQGNIYVEAKDGSIIFQTGTASRSSARIGHGGHERYGNIGNFNADGTIDDAGKANIDVIASGSINFVSPEDNDNERVAQIGHGGYQSPGNAAGDINVEARGGEIRFIAGDSQSPAKIGHGGHVHTWDTDNQGVAGSLRGNINVEAATDIIFRSGTERFLQPEGSDRAFTQIGHGGFGWTAISMATDTLVNGHSGNISVTAGGMIDFMSGQPEVGTAANQAYSMIGHGGYLVRGDHWGMIDVQAGTGIRFEAIGGWDSAKTDGTLGDVRGDTNFVQIGHGGRDNDFEGGNNAGGIREATLGGATGSDRDSTITVSTTTGDIEFIAPQASTIEGQLTEVQSATGGRWSDEDDNLFSLYAVRSWAKIGHTDSGNSAYSEGIFGDISVTATAGAITFLGSDITQGFTNDTANPMAYRDAFNSRRSEQNFTGVGFGAMTSRGIKSGNITLQADGDITLEAGLGRHDHVTVGHSGWDNDGRNNNNSLGHQLDSWMGAISVRSENGNVVLQGGDGGLSRLNPYGNVIHTDLDGTIYSYAQIGHGGRSSNGSVIGGEETITVYAGGGDVLVHAGHGFTDNWALIGHGGRDSRAQFWDGDITVFARDDISLIATENGYGQASNFAQIGHGGWDTETQGDNNDRFLNGATITGEINVTAATGDIILIAGEDNPNPETGGANNFLYEGSESLNPLWPNNPGVLLTGYAGNTGNARHTDFSPGPDGDFGFGPDNIGGTMDDDLAARADNYQQPGADGLYDTPDDVYGGVVGTQESSGYYYSRRGSRGERFDHDDNATAGTDGILLTGDDGNLDFDANIRSSAGWAQIGHGGQHNNITVIDQDINVTAGNDLIGIAGEQRDAKVAIGHNGGPDNWGGNRSRRRSVITGDIDVTVGDDLLLYAGSGDNAAIKIGHGGYQPTSDRSRVEGGSGNGRTTRWEGNIYVKVGDTMILDADENFVFVGRDGGVDFSDPGRSTNYQTSTNDAFVATFGLQDTYAGGDDKNRVLIGHLDTNDNRANHRNIVSNVGATYVAVSRNDPSSSGTGQLITRVDPVGNPNGVVFSSASNGLPSPGSSGELRLYMPNGATGPFGGTFSNQIADGTVINGSIYSEDPGTALAPRSDGTRDDELFATEFTFGVGLDGEPVGDFSTPAEGPYPVANAFGFYFLYFADDPVEPVVVGGPGVTPFVPEVEEIIEDIVVFDPFDFYPFLFIDKFDSFDRDDFGLIFGLTGEEYGLFGAIGLEDAEDNETEEPGPFFLEALLDDALGSRRGGIGSEEEEEEAARLDARLNRALLGANPVFYIFDPDTNRYSSFKVFGVNRAAINRAR